MNAPQTIVPQADPGAGYRAQQAEIDAAVARALASGWYILGEEGEAFEQEFAAWLGATRAVGCGNGTDALALALRGLGIGPGCAVATVSHTAVATVAAIEMAGAMPVLIDIDPTHYTMDPAELAAVLAHPPPGLPPIRAAIPVHLYGQAGGPGRDAAGLPAAWRGGDRGLQPGAWRDARRPQGRHAWAPSACFSLYPTKNLGALGDGGVLATDDAALADRIAALRQYGWQEHYVSRGGRREQPARRAAGGDPAGEADRARCRQCPPPAIAAAYDAALAGGTAGPPARRAGAEHVFHQYVLRVTGARAAVQARLRAEGVGTGIHYPVPVHLQPAYEGRIALGPAGCAETARAAQEVVSLPMYPELTDDQVAHICGALRNLAG